MPRADGRCIHTAAWVMYDIALLRHRGSAPLPVAAGSQSGGRLSVVVLRYSDA